MKEPNQKMIEQIAMLEDVLESVISANTPPIVANFVINSPMYEKATGQIADVLFMYMDENTGEIDGKKAGETLSQMFPSIAQWVNIPRRNFFIKDEVNKIATTLVGKDVL